MHRVDIPLSNAGNVGLGKFHVNPDSSCLEGRNGIDQMMSR
jgi:hypothetical protein